MAKKQPPYTPDLTNPLPALPSVAEVKSRLNEIFPEAFPNRQILVGEMAARVVFVFLYGGFIQDARRWLKPAHIYFFTAEQSEKTSDAERLEWISTAHKPKYRPPGTRWYADNSRETIRDNLIRYRFIELSVSGKRPGYSITANVPIHYLLADFAALFSPDLNDEAFTAAADAWRVKYLNPATIQRMLLKAQGILAKEDDLFVNMPDGQKMRLAGGVSNLIVKGLIESFAREHLTNPAAIWISASDKKAYPQFIEIAKTVGLKFDLNSDLPDVILADLVEPIKFYICEVVATEGPVSEARRQALLSIARASKVPEECFLFLTAFEERSAAPFKKFFSELALGSYVWFRTEPKLLVVLSTSEGKVLAKP
ncbi:BsuBI/PstI family type II restriction endonuclease [Ferrovibrio sp.]|uniref:BsuBI/PstI family type II restriction endonuclease n=1 Tax=Ferrovibrio sp. TaxID=1917215 RepID=UPI003D2D3577